MISSVSRSRMALEPHDGSKIDGWLWTGKIIIFVTKQAEFIKVSEFIWTVDMYMLPRRAVTD